MGPEYMNENLPGKLIVKNRIDKGILKKSIIRGLCTAAALSKIKFLLSLFLIIDITIFNDLKIIADSTLSNANNRNVQETENNYFVDNFAFEGSNIARSPAADNPSEAAVMHCNNADRDFADIRWIDCSSCALSDLSRLYGDYDNATFNEDTVFPQHFDLPQRAELLMEAGKEPGLGIRKLNSQGYTGKNVGIAVIDQVLNIDHPEYSDNIRLYEEMHVLPEERCSMHGSAVVSIAVGKNCGVAPEASLYYWALNPSPTDQAYSSVKLWSEYARVIDRIIAFNNSLPEESKIRVISISNGFAAYDYYKNMDEVNQLLEAVKRANDKNIFVLSTSVNEFYDFFHSAVPFAGLQKINPLEESDNKDNYTLGKFQEEIPEIFFDSVLFPMDSRTTADYTGNTYVHYGKGGLSWVVPYIAGLYCLCVQVCPDINPQTFYDLVYSTAAIVWRYDVLNGSLYRLRIAKPEEVIKCLQFFA